MSIETVTSMVHMATILVNVLALRLSYLTVQRMRRG